MPKTLVIILSETRAHELTFDSFKKNVLDVLNADLCLCIGVKPDYDYSNPFYQFAKYKFTYNEPSNFGDAFNYAYDELTKNALKYEKFENINALHGKLAHHRQSTKNITLYENVDENNIDLNTYNEDEIVIHTSNFPDKVWRGRVYGIKTSFNNDIKQENVVTYKRRLHWREFLKIKNQFLGGIKDPNNQHPGSAGILIFFRWFLLKNLIESDIINQYDRFVFTRSDYIYQLPHPKVEFMDKSTIWIPDSEHYHGYTDRHAILSQQNIEPYLNILNNMILKSNEYFLKMKSKNNWNLEQLIKFNLEQNNVLQYVKEFPYVMYSVRNVDGPSSWSMGNFSNKHGYFIKYSTEYEKSTYYKNKFDKSGLTIDEFYSNLYNYNTNGELPVIGLGTSGFN